MLPLALTWLIGTVVAVGIANFFTQQAFDRSLLDDAYSVASRVHLHGDRLELALTQREVGAVLFDQVETMYFAVRLPDGSLVAGHAGLQTPPLLDETAYRFSDISYQGKNLRAVTLHRLEPLEFDVVMAQTTLSRNALLRRLLTYSIVPQVLLLLLLAAWLHRAIQRDLAPLARLQQAVEQRDARDLTPVPVSASTRDVERLGTAINSLLERVGQGVRAQREFAGNVAHELRTPLAGIRALTEYGLAQAEPEVWREQLQRIAGSQTRASHLVDQLLALALADEAQTGLPLAPVQLDELVHAVVLRHLPGADAAGVDLGARGLDDPVWVEGHAALIEGILNNLIDNALRYGRYGADAAHVTVALQREGERVALSVVDNGPGIPADEQRRLMQRWAQGGAGERLGQGAGLGLAIVARYAQLLNARLELAGGPDGHGLRASVVFAAAAPPA
ncbi:sensor histidine kinase [Variovorax terrae]